MAKRNLLKARAVFGLNLARRSFLSSLWRSELFLTGFILVLLVASVGQAQSGDLEAWIQKQRKISINKVVSHISRPDGAKGSVIASPSKSNPDYYYHWVRDAALTMKAMVNLYKLSPDSSVQARLRTIIIDYANFSRRNQMTPTKGGMGEPKFYVTGAPFNGDWGRPQNDGPPLRAIALIDFAQQLLKSGDEKTVRSLFYDGKIPTHTVIKADLEYVAHHWREPSFDLWEEIRGDHFYNRMVERRALLEGAQLADTLGDGAAAQFYRDQAKKIEEFIRKFVSNQIIIPTINWSGGVDYKTSGLDSAVILGVLHGMTQDKFLPASHALVQSTAKKQMQVFQQIYDINKNPQVPGIAIGRYPEDKYSGTDFSGGNPWILLTLAFAELHYKAAAESRSRGLSALAQRFVQIGDMFLQRVRYHTGADGSMAEQISRVNGYMTGARDLTWSYVSFLSATEARIHAIRR